MCRDDDEELVSNILEIKALPANVHFIKVLSEGNLIAGLERLKKALPARPAYYTHGDYVVSFGNPFDFAELTHGLDFESAYVLDTGKFFENGHQESGIAPHIARNLLTYLVGRAWDSFLASRDLSAKAISRSNRSLWYVRDGLVPNNRVAIAEPGKRKVPISLVGSVKHYGKKYRWHFGFLPSVDLRVHDGIVLSPKAVISMPYNAADSEVPVPIDDKKVLKALNWWNREWRQKLLAMLAWLSGDQPEIAIPAGYQQIVLSNLPQTQIAGRSFAETSDDNVIDQAMESIIECASAP